DLAKIYEELAAKALKTLAQQGVPAKETSVSCQADIRYQGQGLQLTVDFDLKALKKGDLSIIGDPFDEMHKQLFTFALDSDKEIVNLRAVAQGKSAEIEARKLPKSGSRTPVKAAKLGSTTVFMDGKDMEAALYQRSALKAGNKIEGPAVVLEMDSTTVILAGHTGNVDEFGNILIAPTA
ncbi:MAG: hydantoinase/oxoprolinase family protein, partial [Luminiphilus sp.]